MITALIAFAVITLVWGFLKQEVKSARKIDVPIILLVHDGLEWPGDLFCALVRLFTKEPMHAHMERYSAARRKARGED